MRVGALDQAFDAQLLLPPPLDTQLLVLSLHPTLLLAKVGIRYLVLVSVCKVSPRLEVEPKVVKCGHLLSTRIGATQQRRGLHLRPTRVALKGGGEGGEEFVNGPPPLESGNRVVKIIEGVKVTALLDVREELERLRDRLEHLIFGVLLLVQLRVQRLLALLDVSATLRRLLCRLLLRLLLPHHALGGGLLVGMVAKDEPTVRLPNLIRTCTPSQLVQLEKTVRVAIAHKMR